jgi:hypothetical protein
MASAFAWYSANSSGGDIARHRGLAFGRLKILPQGQQVTPGFSQVVQDLENLSARSPNPSISPDLVAV